jgi:hypothetical protein
MCIGMTGGCDEIPPVTQNEQHRISAQRQSIGNNRFSAPFPIALRAYRYFIRSGAFGTQSFPAIHTLGDGYPLGVIKTIHIA